MARGDVSKLGRWAVRMASVPLCLGPAICVQQEGVGRRVRLRVWGRTPCFGCAGGHRGRLQPGRYWREQAEVCFQDEPKNWNNGRYESQVSPGFIALNP